MFNTGKFNAAGLLIAGCATQRAVVNHRSLEVHGDSDRLDAGRLPWCGPVEPARHGGIGRATT